jgi:diguanylate cyclase (GGDEF)-like protein
MNRVLLRLWSALIVAVLFAALPAQANTEPPVFLLGSQEEGRSLASYTGYLVDPSGLLTIHEARTQVASERFAYSGEAVVRQGSTEAVWFRVKFKQTEFNGDWVLTSPFANVTDLQFYGPYDQNGKEWGNTVRTGSSEPFDTRPLGNETFVMPLKMELPGDYVLYIRAVSNIPRAFSFKIWDLPSFFSAGQTKRIFDGLCYGVVVGMLIYNLMLFLVFRDLSYGLYLASGLAALLSILSFNGHIAHYFLPDFPQITDRFNTILPALWIALGSWFAYVFNAMSKFAPITGRIVLATSVLALATAFAAALGWTTLAQALNEYISLAGTIFVATGAVVALRRGFRPARLYLLGQMALFTSVILQVLINWGLMDWPFVYDNGMQAGVAIEVIVFATALSSRIRAMHTVNRDLTRKAEDLVLAAESDPLTGVANRAGLASRARELLVNNRQRTLVMIDLDKFKPINDQHGHAAGDAMLVEIAKRLRAQVRPTDVVARLGGDEFVLLFSEPNDRTTLEAICKRILNAMVQPLLFDGRSLAVGGSLGIARYPADGASLDDLLQAADVAMYHIKKNGRANYAFFEDLSDLEAMTAVQSVARNADNADDSILFDV